MPTLEERVALLESILINCGNINGALCLDTQWDHGFRQSVGTAKAHGIRSEVEGVPPVGASMRMAMYGTAETLDNTEHRGLVGNATNGVRNLGVVGRAQESGTEPACILAEEIDGAGNVLTEARFVPQGIYARGRNGPLTSFEFKAGACALRWEDNKLWKVLDGQAPVLIA